MSKKYDPKEFATNELTAVGLFLLLILAFIIFTGFIYFTWNLVLSKGIAFIVPIGVGQATLLTAAWVILRRWRFE